MTYLELVQRLHTEAGLQGTAPSAVAAQTGMAARLVNWIQDAYADIQGIHETWLFRIADFSFSTTAAKQNYTSTEAGITSGFANWKYNPDPNTLSGIRLYSAVADEQDLEYVPWEDFRAIYKFGSSRTQSGCPTIFTIKPNMSLDLWPIPDAVYTVNGEYVKAVDVLVTNTPDSPVFLSDFHLIILWKALMYYGAFEGAPEAYAHGQQEYNKLIGKMELRELPKPSYGPPLV